MKSAPGTEKPFMKVFDNTQSGKSWGENKILWLLFV